MIMEIQDRTILFYSNFSKSSIDAFKLASELGFIDATIKPICIDNPQIRTLISQGSKYISITRVPSLLVDSNGTTKIFEGDKVIIYMLQLKRLTAPIQETPEIDYIRKFTPQRPRKTHKKNHQSKMLKDATKQKNSPRPQVQKQSNPQIPHEDELESEEEDFDSEEEEEDTDEDYDQSFEEEHGEQYDKRIMPPITQGPPPGIRGGKIDISAIMSASSQSRQSSLEQNLGYKESSLPYSNQM